MVKVYLDTNHQNFELSYRNYKKIEESRLMLVKALIATAITWPLLVIGGPFFLGYFFSRYVGAAWNQSKLLRVLSNPAELKTYGVQRMSLCEQYINDLKNEVISIGKELPIGMRKFLSEEPDGSITWEVFKKKDFFITQKDLKDTRDKTLFKKLEVIRNKIIILEKQKEILVKLDIEKVKKIVQMSYVRNTFIRAEAKEFFLRGLCCLLPTGLLWNMYFKPHNDRLKFDNNKTFLPDAIELPYKDLLDAHNQLVKNDFVVPYFARVLS